MAQPTERQLFDAWRLGRDVELPEAMVRRFVARLVAQYVDPSSPDASPPRASALHLIMQRVRDRKLRAELYDHYARKYGLRKLETLERFGAPTDTGQRELLRSAAPSIALEPGGFDVPADLGTTPATPPKVSDVVHRRRRPRRPSSAAGWLAFLALALGLGFAMAKR
jgi:hypothetical protein